MTRGDIWTVSGGRDCAGKARPVVIIQDDRFAETASVTVRPMTSVDTDAPLVRRLVTPTATNGLRVASRVMVDKIMTVPRAKLGRRIGQLEAEHMAWIGPAIIVFLGIGAPNRHVAAPSPES